MITYLGMRVYRLTAWGYSGPFEPHPTFSSHLRVLFDRAKPVCTLECIFARMVIVVDPTETLRQLRELCKKAQTTYYGECTEITQELDRIVELFDSLDYWLSNGGFIPGQWRPEGRLIRMD